VALTRGGKRRLGGGPPRTPLTAVEKALVERIARALRESRLVADLVTIERAIVALNPNGVEEIIRELSIVYLEARLADTLAAAYRRKAEEEFIRLMRNDATRNAPILQPQAGVRLPSGIIVPASLAPSFEPITEFQINPVRDVITDYIDPAAVRYADVRGAQLVTDIDAANRTAVRYVIRDSLALGRSPADTARLLRDTVGLHTRWARAVVNYDEATMRQLIRAGMTPAQARAATDARVKTYRDRLIRRRAEMIARTEIQLAQNMARQTSWDASNKAGLLDGQSQKEWLVAPSGSRRGAPCDVCAGLNGKRVQWNAAFPTGHTMPPAHPHCRCTAVLIPPSRGLTGLPSQDMDRWLAELKLMDEAV
jgi:hypothetical protein